MKITTPEDFLDSVKDKHLLLDTCVFIDTLLNPNEFKNLFETLKISNVTLVTIEPILIEFIQGTFDEQKLVEKETLINQVIETFLPLPNTLFLHINQLIKLYKEDGKGLSITDLMLGGMLMQYPGKLFLLTKNTTEFPTNIFTLNTHINLLHRKGIHSYRIYSYKM